MLNWRPSLPLTLGRWPAPGGPLGPLGRRLADFARGLAGRLARRRVRRLVGLALAGPALVTAAAVAYVASVDVPDDPLTPQASVLYYRDGRTVLARVGTLDRTDVRLDQVPVGLRRAVLAAEDRDFYGHSGVSPRGIARAGWANTVDGKGEGASTITQQYVRNAYLTQERTLKRKAREIALSIKVEQRYTKDEILERYLNTVYFGRGAYGVQSAAQAFFGVTVDRLNTAQGAVLATLIKDPWRLDPAVDRGAAEDRWRWVLDSMAGQGWLDAGAAASAGYPDVASRSVTAKAIGGPLGLIVDRVEGELDDLGLAPQILRTGGLRVVTTIDAQAQASAIASVGAALSGQPKELRAALVAIDPATGAVRAYYGGDTGRGYFDDAAAPRPPASTFKPLALAVGLRQGISYESRWDGTSPRAFPDRFGVPLINRGGLQCPDCRLDDAMVESLNTPFYALAQRVGPARIRELAIALGIPDRYGRTPSLVDLPGEPRPGATRADIAIGRYPVSPADLATVYATFAAGGSRADRHFVESATWSEGTSLHTATVRRTRVLPAPVAADVTTVLAKVADADGQVPGHRAAAKTGTQMYGNSADNQDAWTAGYVPQLAAVTWVGRAEPGPIRDATGAPIQGNDLPYRIWRAFLGDALAAQPARPFPPPAHLGSADAGDASRVVTSKPGGTGRSAPPSRTPNGIVVSPSEPGKPTGGTPGGNPSPSVKGGQTTPPTKPGQPSSTSTRG